MKPFQLITFDCYSALFDYKSTLIPALAGILNISPAQADEILQLWRARQLEVAALSNSLDKERVSFRECTRLSLDYSMRRHGLSITSEQHTDLVAAWDALKPWPEATAVLKAVKDRGYQLALLSNGDQKMLEALANNIAVSIDHIYSSEACDRYKPHPSIYRLPTSELGISLSQYLHVAGGAGDVIGAKAAGVPCYWSNRSSDYVLMPTYAPDFEGPNLEGLLRVC